MEAYAIDLSEHDMNMEAYVDTFRTALSTLKDGTPSPDIFDHLKVKCYGAEDTPLPSVAQVSSLGATKLQVTVFDPSVLKDVSHAIAVGARCTGCCYWRL
jgi:ribosome recycling factor